MGVLVESAIRAGLLALAAFAVLRVTRVTLSRLLNRRAGISASMALRLAAAFHTSPEFWMNMQSQYDLWQAGRRKQPHVESFDLGAVVGD